MLSVSLQPTSEPHAITIELQCLKDGTSRVHLSIRLRDYCQVQVSFNKKCDLSGGGNGLLWLLTLLALPLCCCCCCLSPEARAALLARVSGREEAASMFPVSETGEKPFSRASLQYGLYGVFSRVRIALDDVRSGQLRWSQLPGRLASPPRHGMRNLPEDDEQELL